MVHFSSHSRSLTLKSSLKSHHMKTFLFKMMIFFHSNDDFFYSNPFFEPKKLSFDDFLMTTSKRENERKKEPEILRPSVRYISDKQ